VRSCLFAGSLAPYAELDTQDIAGGASAPIQRLHRCHGMVDLPITEAVEVERVQHGGAQERVPVVVVDDALAASHVLTSEQHLAAEVDPILVNSLGRGKTLEPGSAKIRT